MNSQYLDQHHGTISLQPITKENWRAVAQLKVTPQQAAFVAEPCYYLALCCYGGVWQPLAILHDTDIIGFCMWAIDPDDRSCWLGGFLIDQRYQGQGYGKRTLQIALALLATQYGHRAFALSYHPTNEVAKRLYAGLGFRETGEWEDDEVVARLHYEP